MTIPSYYIGVDPAYAKPTAWCCVDQDGQVVAADVSRASWEGIYGSAVSQLLVVLPPVVIDSPWEIYGAIEGQFVKKNIAMSLSLARAAALWEAALYTVGVRSEVWRPKPSEWRSKLGVTSKDAAIKYAETQGYDTLGDDDAAEAYGIAMALRAHYGTA